ncbi:D-alanyl-D-alanine endopeptidase [Achromobacter sp. UMC46]|uniref:D-alanyl-D-alanine endopeptidase n=1 Tax=Achromobacter sp. UMC46 TaxID=1862319 RepID=UPI002104E5B9|nr:D-alanyl-D-alanine endopeptidase [Achromobacter sp. UMC46]MBB1596817.1 D-alanyl-D-alanine carboxypeptidase [Achromobacter sp. UMC46]
MAFTWKRAIANAVAPAALAMCALLLPPAALAAKNSDPCKTNAKSAACKAQQAKKPPAAKSGSGKAAAGKQAAPAAKKAAPATAKKAPPKSSSTAKKAPPKGGKQVAAKGTPPKKGAAAGKNGTPKPSRGQRTAAAASAAMPPPAVSVRAEAAALRSSTAYVQDLETSTVLFAKNENVVRPIASISKLMTAVVVVDANLPMDEMLEITDDDVDGLKHTTSRLRVGTKLSRGDMLHLALMSSENRAANALGRHYPGGLPAFVAAMNAKALSLGMSSTHFIEPTGLSSNNVSSPHDLARLLRAASQRPLIHRYSTDTEYDVEINNRTQTFRNTNLLVRKPDWDIKVSKTGYINEAGECLVMLARINGRDLAIVLLDSQGKLSRIGDAVRIRRIVQSEVALASIQPGG